MRRLLLILTTVLVLVIGGANFLVTLDAPQASTRLELEQYDQQLELLVLVSDPRYRQVLTQLDTDEVLEKAAQSYRKALSVLPATAAPLRNQYLSKLGLLEVTQAKTGRALATWDRSKTALARILGGLWQSPPQLLPGAEGRLRGELRGWYRTQALTRLYTLQRRDEAATALATAAGARARAVLGRQLVSLLTPVLGLAAGVLVLGGWVLWRRKQPAPPSWRVPWSVETTWEGVVFWFAAYLSLSILVGSVAAALKLNRLDAPGTALLNLFTYGLLAAAGIALIQILVLGPHGRGPDDELFRYDLVPGWWKWGVGGWLVGFPLVFAASTLAQQLLGGRGGGNPLLEGIGEANALPAQIVLFVAVAVAAPLFEETFFRGFVFPALASRLPLPVAVVGSACLFAIAHWSAVEFLPLTALGIILVTVYHYTRTLAPCILLHALWNGGTFLFLLGLGQK